MSPRSIRRAAERQALKDARLAANQANAQLSTGPKTKEGKAKSRLNAVKTGLTGRTVLLPTDDVPIYEKHIQEFVDEYQPLGPREAELVQALADHSWRLDRIAVLEHALYAHGFELFSEQFADRGHLQAGFTQMHTFLHYEKQFRNLQTQEMRIRRNREKDTGELNRLQAERREKARLAEKYKALQTAQTTPKQPVVGFEFSPPESSANEVEWLDRNDPNVPSPLASSLQSRAQAAGQPSATEL
jgi:hypothetical protein